MKRNVSCVPLHYKFNKFFPYCLINYPKSLDFLLQIVLSISHSYWMLEQEQLNKHARYQHWKVIFMSRLRVEIIAFEFHINISLETRCNGCNAIGRPTCSDATPQRMKIIKYVVVWPFGVASQILFSKCILGKFHFSIGKYASNEWSDRSSAWIVQEYNPKRH